jgi:hypothetical protein
VAGVVWILIAALASRPGAAQQQPTIGRTVISLPGYAAPIALDTMGLVKDVPASPARAFAALRVVYDELKIPVSIRDTTRHYIGNLHFTRMHNLGNKALSQIVECGSDMTGPRADRYRVHFAIMSRVDSLSPTVSRVRSAVVAGAEDVLGPSKEPISCGSSGVLESRIAELVLNLVKVQ